MTTPYNSALINAVGKTKNRKERSVPVPQFVLDELAVQCEGRSLDDLRTRICSTPISTPSPQSLI
jgi:hypothetical protein